MLASAVVGAGGSVEVAAFPGEAVWVAGAGDGDGVLATDVAIAAPVDVAFDVDGSLLVLNSDGGSLLRVDTAGVLSTVVPSSTGSSSGDGLAASAASLGRPTGLAVDASGIFVSDRQVIRRIDRSTGVIDRFAGDGFRQFTGNGPALDNSLGDPLGLASDGAGGVLVAERYNSRVRRVAGGQLSSFAGAGGSSFGGDGAQAELAQVNQPSDVFVEASGGVLIADTENHRVRRVSTDGVITTIAGTGAAGYSGDGGAATAAQMNRPASVVADADGNVFVTDDNHVVRRIDTTGTITTVAGTGTAGYGGDGGPAVAAQLDTPRGVAVDSSGRVVVADANNSRVRRFTTDGTIETIAGNGETLFSVLSGPARSAGIGDNGAVGVDRDGNLVIGDSGALRRVDAGGSIQQIAGSREMFDPSGDGGPASAATFVVYDLAFDVAGNTFIADGANDQIRRIDPTGTITTVADASDGLSFPTSVAVAPDGTLVVGDRNRVARIDLAGTVTTIAGDANTSGFSGDGGPAVSARFDLVEAVAVDGAGNVFVSDYYNGRIRRIDAATGNVDTVAVTALGGPRGIAADSAGNVYYTEVDGLWQLNPAGEQRQIMDASAQRELTLGGSPASAVEGGTPYDVAVAPNGDLFVLSHFNSFDIGYLSPSWVYRIENVAAADLRTYVATAPTPKRIIDTRDGTGTSQQKLEAGDVLEVAVAGQHGVDVDAAAVMVNVTAARSEDGFLRVTPCGSTPTTPVSTLNHVESTPVANATIARLGEGGAFCIETSSSTDVIVDLQGWFPASTDYRPAAPTRLVDTRIGVGVSARIEPGEVHRVRLAGNNEIALDASAIAMNVTAANPASAGYITAFPCDEDPPLASNLNTWPGHAIANLAITSLDDGGAVCFTGNVETELVVDLIGWFPLSTNYEALTPQRLADSRDDGAKVKAFTPYVVSVDDVPADAAAAILNITAAAATSNTYVTVYACDEEIPVVSNTNASSGRNVAAVSVTALDDDNNVCLVASSPTHLIVDLQGWHDG